MGQVYEPDRIPMVNGDSVVIRPFVAGDQRYIAGKGGDDKYV